MIRRSMCALAAGALLWPCAFAQQNLGAAADEFIDHMVVTHGFERDALVELFDSLRVNPKVVELITPASAGGRKVFWDDYRARHLGLRNVANGALFMQRHRTALQRATEQYGVPSAIIAAIIGVETRYGSYTGNFSTVETLATLGLTYLPRATYFLGELEQLLVYARDANVPVTELRGSYAGALGYPQFMPTSARTWAVDFDGDGVIDLFNFDDAIGSVANFLAAHGWQRDMPVAFAIDPQPHADPEALLAAGIYPKLDAAQFAAAGLPVAPAATRFNGKLALVDLDNVSGTEYRAGTLNYYVLTRYNRSNKYAMTVFDLAAAISS